MSKETDQKNNGNNLPNPAALTETDLERLAEEVVRKLREMLRDEFNRRGC